MNKAMIIEKMAKLTKRSKAECRKHLEAVTTVIKRALKSGDSVGLTGFGTFSTMKRKARNGTNPSTGKKMLIPAKRVPKFKPGKGLKAEVQ
jgi:DNA-binding protein HU-beta